MLSARQFRRGFTLVELLVVIAIIGTLVALLLPSLSSARSAANASASANNLSTFGRGFELYASGHDGAYSSGAFDHYRDGRVDQNGWVADLIGTKVANPGKSLDPAHSGKVNETVGTYTGALTTGAGDPALFDASMWVGTADAAASLDTYGTGTPERRDMWNEGHNSNYASTFHFSRGDPTDASGYNTTKAKGDGDGPLSQTVVSGAKTTAARIAVMGPGRRTTDIGTGGITTLKTWTGNQTIAKPGDRYTKNFTDGMLVAAGSSGTSGEFFHDLTGVYPLHSQKTADGGNGFAPVLFADLHVDKVFDKTGDGNIGGTSAAAIDANQYQEATEQIWIKRLRDPD